MIIDFHVHPFCKEATVLPDYDEALHRQFDNIQNDVDNQTIISMLKENFIHRSINDLIAEMDANNIDKACIVAMDLSTRYGVEMVTNHDVAKFSKQFPNRFIPFASVDPNMGRLAVDKLVYAIDELGCKGLKLVAPVQNFDIAEARFDPLWNLALDRDIVVWTHCAHQKSHPGSDARLGHPMRVEPLALKYPDMKIVLGHGGFPWTLEAWSLAYRHTNVYVDISAYPTLYDQFPWEAYSRHDCEHKLLFASDMPLVTFQETLSSLMQVGLSKTFFNKILFQNAASLLDLKITNQGDH